MSGPPLTRAFVPDPERTVIVRTYGDGYYVAEDYHTGVIVQEWHQPLAKARHFVLLVALYLFAGIALWMGGFYVGRAYEVDRQEIGK